MGYKDFSKLEAKLKLLGIQYNNLNNYGFVVHNSDNEDLLYLPFKNKPLKISREICIPEYTAINGIVILRYARETIYKTYNSYIRLYFPYENKAMTFEELQYISSFNISNRRLPSCNFSVSSSEGCAAIILKLSVVGYEGYTRKLIDKTYIISKYGYKKQVSSKYVSVGNAGWDGSFHRKLVLLQIGRSASQFSGEHTIHPVDKVYLDNNYINEVFTKYKLLSPSDKLIVKE